MFLYINKNIMTFHQIFRNLIYFYQWIIQLIVKDNYYKEIKLLNKIKIYIK